MKHLLALLLLSGSLNAFASPFVEEDFVPVAESGYGCYVFDDTGKQIMVSDVHILHFDKQAFKPIRQSILPNHGRFAKQARYQAGKNQLIFRAIVAQKLNAQDRENGILDKANGQFEYRQNGRVVYRGNFKMECGI
ncbi:hypothetical protein ACKLNO_11835 [Neisseriaceae bacterium B1]